jgi:hypothetical protein
MKSFWGGGMVMQRYRHDCDDWDYFKHGMFEDEAGEWVKHEDAKDQLVELQTQLQMERVRNQELRRQLDIAENPILIEEVK